MRRLTVPLLVALLVSGSPGAGVEVRALVRLLKAEYDLGTYYLEGGGYGQVYAPLLGRAGEYLVRRLGVIEADPYRSLAAVAVHEDSIFWVWAYLRNAIRLVRTGTDGRVAALGYFTGGRMLATGACADGTPILVQVPRIAAASIDPDPGDWIRVATAPLYGDWSAAVSGIPYEPSPPGFLDRLKWGSWAETSVLLILLEGPLISSYRGSGSSSPHTVVWCDSPSEVGFTAFDTRSDRWVVVCFSIGPTLLEDSSDPRDCWRRSTPPGS